MFPITRSYSDELNKEAMIKKILNPLYFHEMDLDVLYLKDIHNFNPPIFETAIINSFQERLNNMYHAAVKTVQHLEAQGLVAQQFEIYNNIHIRRRHVFELHQQIPYFRNLSENDYNYSLNSSINDYLIMDMNAVESRYQSLTLKHSYLKIICTH
jgi:hypothetical protein